MHCLNKCQLGMGCRRGVHSCLSSSRNHMDHRQRNLPQKNYQVSRQHKMILQFSLCLPGMFQQHTGCTRFGLLKSMSQ